MQLFVNEINLDSLMEDYLLHILSFKKKPLAEMNGVSVRVYV